jgi:hypothetical protein
MMKENDINQCKMQKREKVEKMKSENEMQLNYHEQEKCKCKKAR